MELRLIETTRRESLALAAMASLAAFLAPKMAMADEQAVAAEIKRLYGDKKFDDGKIKLDVPEIAENGLVVPVNVEIESPMTEQDYVKSVHVFADGNPFPGVVTYRFTPACGKAAASAACDGVLRKIVSANDSTQASSMDRSPSGFASSLYWSSSFGNTARTSRL